MPLVKRQSGWFWGSKGPFDTKAQALSVARAAYASGYREADAEAVYQRIVESQIEQQQNPTTIKPSP